MSEVVRLTAGRLWIEFFRAQDRWGHRIGVEGATVADGQLHRTDAANDSAPSNDADSAQGIQLESLEGTAEQNWPPSPALQELHLEPRPDGTQVALLVGMAGTSHWSLSVEVPSAGDRIVFDVACRVKIAVEWLGSTYRAFSTACDGYFEILDGERSDRPSAGTGEPRQTRIRPAAGSAKLPRTVCWRYAIALPKA